MTSGGDVTDVWTNAEIVRAVIALTNAVRELTDKIEGLGSEYVRKEVYDLREAAVERRLDILGTAHADLDADLSRHHRDHQTNSRSTWMAFVPPIVTGVIVAVLAALYTLATTTH